MQDTGAYDTVKSTTSIMDDTSAHVLEYRIYWWSSSFVFTPKDIMGMIIFVSGDIKYCKNGALKVVNVAVFSKFENIESCPSYLRGILTTSSI